MANADNNIASQNEIVLGENEMVCSLTNRVVKATDKEMTLQSMIAMMTEEYGFAPEDMERDYKVKYDDAESGKTKTQKVDLAIFNAGHAHDVDELIRFIIVAKDAKVKSNDKKNGVEATIENILCTTDCEFACWTNGEDLQYVHISYRRRFWVGVKEQNTPEGQHEVAERIKGIFEDLKDSNIFKDVFDGNEQIMLSDRGLAFVASELAKYSFLDATVDVKGTAYETIVSNTLKQEAGQFFTPRNIIKCMVEMLDPDQNCRVLDPACGSGGFLVMVLDHVRHKIAKNFYPELDDIHLEAKLNSAEVDDAVREYAEKMIFGFDFDPDLKKAARMNMVMAGDGHSNIYNINSLDYPYGSKPDVPHIAEAVNESIKHSADRDFHFGTSENNAQGKFDMVFTNPPFGTKVEVDQEIAARYELNSKAPEVLFIEACYNFLKPGGKMAIVLPDGILGNPNTESVRLWILQHFKLLASVDLPVETFLPQVGVQASLLFLQKKTDAEMLVPIEDEDYDVFMAIVEQVGKDRRGVPVYEKDDDGAEILFEHYKKWLTYADNGREIVRQRRERIKHLADDLPKVAKAYKEFKEEHE